MREGDEGRVSRHEAGHAVASLLYGRLIEYAVVDGDWHEVKNVPVARNRIPIEYEAVILASGWAAEARYFTLTSVPADEIETDRLFGGHRDDWNKLDELAERGLIDADLALARADQLVAANWDVLEVVAQALLDEKQIDQSRLEELCTAHGVSVGQVAGSGASGDTA